MSLRTVALGSTFEVYFNTTQFSTGAPFALASGAMELRRYGNDTEITAGLTLSLDHDTVTGFHELTIVAATAGLVAGAIYDVVIGVGTIDSVSAVGKIVDRFRVETAAELAAREFQEAKFTDHVVATVTSNSTTVVNLSDILPSAALVNHVVGDILTIQWVGGTYAGLVLDARITAYAVTNQLATVELLNGGALPEALAAGDMIWRTSQYTADAVKISGSGPAADNVELAGLAYSVTRGLTGTALPAVAADDAGGVPVSDAGGLDLDTQLAATNEVTAARMGALTDWIDGNRLDLILDIIAADTTTDIPALIATLQAAIDTLTPGVIIGAAATGTLSATQCTSDLTGYVNDELIGRTITFTGGTADGQQGRITDYASASGLVTFTTITTAPANADTFKIT